MERIFASPGEYIQGEHVYQKLASYIGRFGKEVFLLTDEIVWSLVGEEVATDLKIQGFKMTVHLSKGAVTSEEIQAIAEIAEKAQMLLVIGGGKMIDLGKAVADSCHLPVVVLPTVAATDAPTSALSVLYDEAGYFKAYSHYKKHPAMVVVDTAVIIKAPVNFLISGIADALATNVEVQSVWRSKGTNLLGGRPTLTAKAIAEACEKTIFNDALAAVEANRQQVINQAFENVVEANTLMSGLGFESGGLAAAHAIHNGFSRLEGEIHRLSHGEKVAFTTLVHLVLEKAPQTQINRHLDLYRQLGLPVTLKEMHLDHFSRGELAVIGQQAIISEETMQQMPFTVTADDIVKAILTVDEYGQKSD